MQTRHALRVSVSIVISLVCVATELFAATYRVGPGQQYASIGAVPWIGLGSGDSVLIHYRDTPYREKWVICIAAAANRPFVVSGVVDAQGRRPVIDGNGALTDARFNYWNENRGIIKIGGANTPSDTLPGHIVVENLELKSARPPYTFSGRSGEAAYAANAAAIYIEKGTRLVIRNCVFHDCGNGFFSASQSADVLVEQCHYYDNGIENSIYEHNNYTESQGIVFQHNHFGPLRAGCPGNNLKDRSSGCVIRYNWIEAGNRQLDLVHSSRASIIADPAYRATFVYGNILIEPDGAGNSQICHYGGDDPARTADYRKGTLYFYNNTVVSTRSGNTTLIRLSSPDETADIRNTIYYGTAPGSSLAILDSDGTAFLRSCWLKTGWRASHSNAQAAVADSGGLLTGTEPGFSDGANQDFRLIASSPCTDAAGAIAAPCLADHTVLHEYVRHQSYRLRSDNATAIGAFGSSTLAIRDGMRQRLRSGLQVTVRTVQPGSRIRFTLQDNASSGIIFSVYDLSGRMIMLTRTPVDDSHSFEWDGCSRGGERLAPGAFMYTIHDRTQATSGIVHISGR